MVKVVAAISRAQFKKCRDRLQKVERRRAIARLYDQLLEDIPEIETPIEKEWAHHSYCRYIVRPKKKGCII